MPILQTTRPIDLTRMASVGSTEKMNEGRVINAQWVDAKDDGTYTSPGEGWKEFIPTEKQTTLELASPDGYKVT